MASKFESAFAAARKAGKKTFTFGGKSYNTKLKSTSKSAPVPRPRSERKTTPAGAKGRTSAPSRASKGGFRGSGYAKVPGIGFAQYRSTAGKRKMGGSF